MLRLDRVEIAEGAFRLRADWQAAERGRIAVIGPSGAGKSTLLAAVAGFVTPVSGRVLWRGQDLTPLPPAARPVSILFQDNNLFPHLTVAQNVGLGLRPDLRLTDDDRARVADSLARVGLDGKETRRPGALSGGEQGRVALARVLLRARPILLLDEPFSALGPALRAEMLDLVAEVAGESGATVLLVSHDPQDARRFADEIVVVMNGVAAPPAPAGPLLDDPPAALRDYLG